MNTNHDNVHRLHGDVQDQVHEDVHDDLHDVDAGIVHETAERIDTDQLQNSVHDGEVVDAELLTEEESAALDERLANRGALVRRAVTTGQVAKRVAVRVGTHDRTKSGSKTAARYAYTVVKGGESFTKRAWDASTMGVYRRQIKAAEAAGDREALKEWTAAKEAATERRHRRLMDAPKLAWGVLKVAVGATLATPVIVFVIAVFAKLTGSGSFTGVWGGFFALIGFVIAVGGVLWTLLTFALPVLFVIALFREGKRAAEPPAWMVTTADAEWDSAIDESTIAQALDSLRIPNITRYLKQGYKLQFITPARQQGRGTHAVIRLPGGVPAAEISKRRVALATSLHRAGSEVWPNTGDEAGILDLWVADKGALANGPGVYPLLTEGLVDVFKGVPAGKTLRGDDLREPVMGRNSIVGGAPEQGKSSASRTFMAGCALDPTVEMRIWVPDQNFDFERFKRRCSRYVMGADDDSIRQIRDDLKEMYDELQRRGDLLVAYETEQVTRELADKNIGLHPLVALLEEAHVAFQHDEYGEEIAKYAVAIVKLGRKRGMHLRTSTQAPTATSLPKDITRNCTNNVAFYVQDYVANDGLLGQGAYKQGVRATDLIPGENRGTSIVKGFTAAKFETLQWYFLSGAEGNDQITPIIERALAAISKRNLPTPDARRRPELESRDLLADLDQVLGDDPVRIADVPALLKRLAPTWTPYQSLTGKALREQLAAGYGIKVASTGNRYPLDPATVRDAIVRRDRDSGQPETDETGDGDDASDLAS
ncbi:cell division protein FtsK [Kribbella pratensis]|uniref:S-DNA-T family DNA segregation ATPase FtsK/SpoIIIE n=1 Tax=Kribbella pratensis TaxID=2512112 RepID=A0A4R8BV28_9ACTN|nr:cell division protein FtsK [Kribbella pratensis]TDW65621.1 S-DNA-T family DNA segregation ATPase FtsK/SpoIIIE [Kribbella pratensis]